MTLAPGTKLGPYEIQSPLGAGGMGEVYRGRDTRLDRTVAVKILPSHLSSNPEAKQRFEREARAISGLSHPNICHLYDVGSQDGIDFLVMEYLEGETLADRLRRGPLPVEQILRSAMEICEGLEKAHRSGVVHRDLKPGNIMLTKSGAKLMDFGLAKTSAAAAAPVSEMTQTLASPSSPLTAQGTIVGTFQYMAPEQVEGKEADARSDIFSLGTVLYEMTTGKRAFEGKTTASTIAAILAADPPPISSIQPMSPLALQGVVKNCLAKDPDDRLQSAHDVKLQLKWIAESGSATPATYVPAAAGTRRDRFGWLAAGLFLLLLIAGSATWWVSAHRVERAMYFNSSVPFPTNYVALSPDGRTLALVAYSDQANKNVIWIQQVGGRGATVLQGTEGAAYPFWSPDGRSLGFFADGKLKTIDATSGRSAQLLADAPFGRGGAWSKDGVILFTPDAWSGLYRVSSSGGTPAAVTKPDVSQYQVSNRWPVFLPDGRHFLYLACNFSGRLDKNMIFVGSLDSDEKRPIVTASTNAVYADPGYLLYWRDNALVAQRFDLHNYSLAGEPRIVSDAVQYFPQTNFAVFDAAGKTLVAQTRAGKGANKSQLTWFDRHGKQVGLVGPQELVSNPKLSPDGKRVAVDQIDTDGRHVNIWVHELNSDAASRLGFGPWLEQVTVWSPDGKQVIYTSNEKLFFSLYIKNADGSGSAQNMIDLGTPQQGPWDWSRDGKYILLRKDRELWYMTLPDRQAHPLLQSQLLVRNAQFSPDEKFVAYASSETGNWEVYVSPFPGFGSKWQVSRGGGEEPRWRGDGEELFYLAPDGKLMAADVKTGAGFEAGSPTALFQIHARQPLSAMDFFSYDVTRDGQKFLVNTKVDTSDSAPLSVILNWGSELSK
ncbi:MAG: serine/threonine-protein kinase [Acidobacteriia bacterium]|nr:serine/threonine-protein kinase [Terriglobia bacterium]